MNSPIRPTDICTVIYRRSATVEHGPRTVKLFSKHTAPIVPRTGEFISLDVDSASWIVDSVEYDYTTIPVTVNIYVK